MLQKVFLLEEDVKDIIYHAAFNKATHAASGLVGGVPRMTSFPPFTAVPAVVVPVAGLNQDTEYDDVPGKSTSNVAVPGNLYVTTALAVDSDIYPASIVDVPSATDILLVARKLNAYPASFRAALLVVKSCNAKSSVAPK